MPLRCLPCRLFLFICIIILLVLPSIFASKVKADQSGPHLIRDFNRINESYYYRGGTFFQGNLYFGAYDTEFGNGLWRTDGTLEGTEPVYNGIFPTTLSPFNMANRVSLASAELNDILYFGAENYPDSVDLWRTDGTNDGTYLVKRIVSEPGSVFRTGNPVSADGFIWFPIDDNNGLHSQLWRSDGTNNGTVKVADYFVSDIAVLNGKGYFRNGSGLMRTRSDGGVEQLATVDIKDDLNISGDWGMIRNISTDGWLYFSNAYFTWFTSLLATNGESVFVVKQAVTGDVIYDTAYMAQLGSSIYFSGTNSNCQTCLWKLSIGSTEATVVKEFSQGSISYLTPLNGQIFFRLNNGANPEVKTLWKSNGTLQGTQQVCPTCNFSIGDSLIAFQGRLYFTNSDVAHGNEIWVTDGTITGTSLFKDINPGTGSSDASIMSADEKMLVFRADDGQHGLEPWGFYLNLNNVVFLPVINR